MTKKGLLVVVSGPSGAGKGTICKALLKKRDDMFLSVSATTRAPREGEVDGEHYHFLSEEEFKDRIANGGMLEHAVFCDNYYGTPKKEVDAMLNEGKTVILEIEVQGAMTVRSKYPEGAFVFVLPPSMEELKRRLVGRGTETEEVVEQRLARALEEIKLVPKYNYVLVNDNIDDAVCRLEEIIDADKCRMERSVDFIENTFNVKF